MIPCDSIVTSSLALIILINNLDYMYSYVLFMHMVTGNEDALQMLVQHKAAMSMADNRGWLPLHQAAVQQKRTILEITFSGLYVFVQNPKFT